MRAICIESYYDKVLHRTVTVGEEIELDQKRFKQLSSANNDAKQVLVKAKKDTTEKEIPEKKG